MLVICLMGPTASGKTDAAITLARQWPCEIISVDSVMVYQGMDIGTAKPSSILRTEVKHHLIDICDPTHPYSAGAFCQQALSSIREIIDRGKIPLLTGGTMLYFRALQQGIAPMPPADAHWRAQMQTQPTSVLYQQLCRVDPITAQRLSPNDAQRIQRALEVFHLTGQTMSTFFAQNSDHLSDFSVLNVALMPQNREELKQRIADRFHQMLDHGLIAEVENLYQRDDLSADLPALRAVGYRQVWAYLSNQLKKSAMTTQAITATQQLAKRQLTWLRSWPNCQFFDNASALIYFLQQQIESSQAKRKR